MTTLGSLRLGLVAMIAMSALAAAQGVLSAPEVPAALKAPPGERVVFRAHALGAQVYLCTPSADGKGQWVLKAPDAQLRDDHGAVIGHHGAGPSWKHLDGSEVTGKMSARADSPDERSIPWLLLTATGHSGDGVFAHVTSVQLIHTEGGKAPDASTCDPTKEKAKEARIAYSADYYFYAPAEGTLSRP